MDVHRHDGACRGERASWHVPGEMSAEPGGRFGGIALTISGK